MELVPEEQVLEMKALSLQRLGKQEETSKGLQEVASDTGGNPETVHNGSKKTLLSGNKRLVKSMHIFFLYRIHIWAIWTTGRRL